MGPTEYGGESPFCESFFDNAKAERRDLIGEINRGWTVGKRLLQHERSGVTTLAGGAQRSTGPNLPELARQYLGESDGRISALRVWDGMAIRSLIPTKQHSGSFYPQGRHQFTQGRMRFS
jgi:hypothetical protein